MWHWVNQNGNAIGAVAAVLAVLITIGGLALRELRRIRKDGAEQVQRQRNFDVTWYGKDPEYPGGPRVPGMPERVASIEKNTQGMPEQLLEVQAGLGKAHDRIDAVERRLADVESVIIRSSAPPIT